MACLRSAKATALSLTVGDRAKIFQDLLVLQREAERFSIDITVDDEFGRLSDEDRHRDIVDINRLRIQRLNQPSGVFRLMPDGCCSMGIELQQEMSNDAPLWHPSSENGWDFIERVRRDTARKQKAVPVIPYRSTTKNVPKAFGKALYRGRARIEQAIGKLKRFKRIALRCHRKPNRTSPPSSPSPQRSARSNPSSRTSEHHLRVLLFFTFGTGPQTAPRLAAGPLRHLSTTPAVGDPGLPAC